MTKNQYWKLKYACTKSKNKWYPLTSENYRKHSRGTGVYIITWRTSPKRPVSIDRLDEKDRYGILYIGKQTWPKKGENFRLYDFVRAAVQGTRKKPGSKNSAGNMYQKHLRNIAKKNGWQLFFKFMPQKSLKPGVTETECMRDYCNWHGELPPLNNQFSGKKSQGGKMRAKRRG